MSIFKNLTSLNLIDNFANTSSVFLSRNVYTTVEHVTYEDADGIIASLRIKLMFASNVFNHGFARVTWHFEQNPNLSMYSPILQDPQL